MRKCALEVGIPDSYRMAIMFLSKHPGANQKQLAEFANKTTAAVNKTVKEMQSDGFVMMETDENDRRYTRLFLTEKGSLKADVLRDRLHRSDDIITARITKDREEELIALLNEVYGVIKEEL
jgi:DNA-binding MarR family transcriptional regulator